MIQIIKEFIPDIIDALCEKIPSDIVLVVLAFYFKPFNKDHPRTSLYYYKYVAMSFPNQACEWVIKNTIPMAICYVDHTSDFSFYRCLYLFRSGNIKIIQRYLEWASNNLMTFLQTRTIYEVALWNAVCRCNDDQLTKFAFHLFFTEARKRWTTFRDGFYMGCINQLQVCHKQWTTAKDESSFFEYCEQAKRQTVMLFSVTFEYTEKHKDFLLYFPDRIAAFFAEKGNVKTDYSD